MATTPSTPGGNPPSSGNGKQPPPPNKPRATIVLKKGGSSPVITPASGASPVNLQRPTAPRQPGNPSQSARRPAVQIQADREALGLSAARPSEMVAGLDEAVKRAEALANREEAKRRSGGKLNANVALHVDDTGKKWALWVRMGIAVAVVAVCAAGYFMLYKSNHVELNPRVKLAETRDALNTLEIAAKDMQPFESSDAPTAQTAKERLRKSLDAQLDVVKKSIQKDRDSGRNPDKALINKREFLEKLMQFKDGWDKPFEFSVTGGELAIRSTSQAEGVPAEPVKIRITGSAGKTEKEDK